MMNAGSGLEFVATGLSIQNVQSLNATVRYLRSDAARPVTFGMDPMSMSHQCQTWWSWLDGRGTEQLAGRVSSRDCRRKAHMSTNREVSPISWRSANFKRNVSSTLAEKTLALSQAVAEVEWLQVMFEDTTVRDVTVRDKPSSLLALVTSQRRIVDARSSYDVLSKGSALQVGPASSDTRRRPPRPSWPKPNGALEHLIKTCHFTWVQEQAMVKQ